MRKNLIVVGLLALVLTACGGQRSESYSEIGAGLDGGSFAYDEESVEASESPQVRALSEGAINLDLAVSSDRKVIRTVSLQLAADDTRGTYEAIISIAEGAGGFVAQADVSPADQGQPPYIYLTVRVPSANLGQALAQFKEAAEEVVAESQGAADVTENFIDLEAQLANLTLLETELRALLEEVRQQPDADPEKLLRVFTEISTTRGQIEQIQGQLNYLTDAVDLATVSVEITPTPAAVPVVDEGWAPAETVRNASRDLVAGLQRLVDAGITFVIAVLPMLLLVLGTPLVVLFLAYRWWRRRHPDRPTAQATPQVAP